MIRAKLLIKLQIQIMFKLNSLLYKSFSVVATHYKRLRSLQSLRKIVLPQDPSQSDYNPTKLINRRISQEIQISSQIMKSLKERDIYLIKKRTKNLSVNHLAQMMSRIISLHKIKIDQPQSCITQKFLDILRLVETNYTQMNPQSLIYILESLSKLNNQDHQHFIVLQQNIIQLFVADNSLKLITRQLTVRLIFAIKRLSRFRTQNHVECIKLLKLCLNRIEPELRVLPVYEKLKLHRVISKYGLQKTNFLKALTQQCLKISKFISVKPYTYLAMLDNLLKNVLIRTDFRQNLKQYNLICRLVRQINSKIKFEFCKVAQLTQFYQLISRLNSAEINLIDKKKPKAYYAELVLELAIKKYKSDIAQAADKDQIVLFDQFKDVINIATENHSYFVFEMMKRFIEICALHKMVIDVKFKIILINYCFRQSFPTQVIQPLIDQIKNVQMVKLDNQIRLEILESFQFDTLIKQLELRYRFNNLVSRCLKYIFRTSYQMDQSLLCSTYKLICSVVTYSNQYFQIVLNTFNTAFRLASSLDQWIVDQLVKDPTILYKTEQVVRDYDHMKYLYIDHYDIKLKLIRKITTCLNMVYGLIFMIETTLMNSTNQEVKTTNRRVLQNFIKKNIQDHFMLISYEGTFTLDNLQKIEFIQQYLNYPEQLKFQRLEEIKKQKIQLFCDRNKHVRNSIIAKIKSEESQAQIQTSVIMGPLYIDVLHNKKIGYIIMDQDLEQNQTQTLTLKKIFGLNKGISLRLVNKFMI